MVFNTKTVTQLLSVVEFVIESNMVGQAQLVITVHLAVCSE